MKKIAKDKQKPTAKTLKEFVPQTFTHLRENNPVFPPNQANREYYPDIIPREIPKEWNDQEVKEAFSNQEEGKVYSDQQCENIFLPHSLYHDYLNNEVKWSRPDEYIKESLIDKEVITHFPNKNKFKFKSKIREMYIEEKEQKESGKIIEMDDIFSDHKRDKYSLYRDFFKIIDSKPEMRIVNSYSRDETDEEYEERLRKEEEKLIAKMKKDPKQKQVQPQAIKKKKVEDIPLEKKKKHIATPSNISMKNGYPLFCRWLASIYQVIKDRNILDVNTNEPIWQKIYPQENNIPIYNPNGKYIVKLYYMGKHRQIEIDDTMPCSRYDEFYLPRCELLNELWPSILTKSIIKLYSYAYVSTSYKECGDYAPFYSLTGLIPQTLHFDSVPKKLNSESIELVKDVLSDENYRNKNMFLLCYRKEKEEAREEAKDIIKQVRLKKEDRVASSSSKRVKSIAYRRQSTELGRSTQSLIELKRLRARNQLPSQMTKCIDDIDMNTPFKKMMKKKQTNAFFKQTMQIDSKETENEKDIDQDKESEKEKDKGIDRSGEKNQKKTITKNQLGTIYQSSLKEGMEKYQNKIFIGILYDVIEYFDNKEFNMNRLKPIDFSDLKDMVKQLNTVYVFKQLTKEEKKVYIDKLKVIKQNQKNEKAKRIEDLQSKGSSVQCLKINNSSVEEPKVYISYADDEIEMTKKSILNKWEYPPIEYLEKVFVEKAKFNPKTELFSPAINEKTILQKEKMNLFGIKAINETDNDNVYETNNANSNNVSPNLLETFKGKTWNKDVYLQLINNDLEQYSNSKEPIVREKGTWVDIAEFFNCFNSILLLCNPNVFQNNIDWDNNIYNSNEYLSINKSNQVMHLSPDDSDLSMSSYAIIMFSANPDNINKYRDIPYKINFELITKNVDNNKKLTKSKLTLRTFLDTKQLKLDKTKEYFILYEGGIFPSGFYIKLLTNFKFEAMTYCNYLIQNLNYAKMSFRIDHPIIEKNQPLLLLRLLVTIKENAQFYLITNQKDQYIIEFTQCVLINCSTMNKKMIVFDNLISLNSNESNEYLIIISVNSPYNLQEESYDVDILFDKSSSVATAIDNIPAYEVCDYYVPNKHYILFQEFVFAGDKTYAMMYIKIRKLIKVDNEDELVGSKLNVISSNAKDKEKASNANINPNTNHQLKEIPIKDKIRLKIELYGKEKELISSFDFYNETILFNYLFEGNVLLSEKDKNTKATKANNQTDNNSIPKPGNTPYFIRCYVDTTELPSWFNNIEEVNGIGWLIRLYSSDTLGFCKDTTKEDQEKSMINSWEQSEPGRSKRAQMSRRRFLLEKKKAAGYTLTEEDDTFISNPRQKKLGMQNVCQTESNSIAANSQQKNKKDSQVKTKGKNEKDQLLQQQMKTEREKDNEINMNKDQPQSESHTSLYIKNYLFYAYRDRLLKLDSNIDQSESKHYSFN